MRRRCMGAERPARENTAGELRCSNQISGGKINSVTRQRRRITIQWGFSEPEMGVTSHKANAVKGSHEKPRFEFVKRFCHLCVSWAGDIVCDSYSSKGTSFART